MSARTRSQRSRAKPHRQSHTASPSSLAYEIDTQRVIDSDPFEESPLFVLRRLATAGLVPSSAIDQQPRYWNEPVAGSAGCAHAGLLHRSATATESARLIRERIETTFHEWVLDGASLSGAHTPSDDNDAERIRTRSPVRTECAAPRRRRWHGRSADPNERGDGCSRPPNTRISASSSNNTTRTGIASSVPLPISRGD